MPTEIQFFSESLHSLEVCKTYCQCHDYWHFLWAVMKAAGLRRGIYLQQHLFDALLADRRDRGQRVLIAGSADAGSLQVLHHALGSDKDSYHALDRCYSSLQLLAEFAHEKGIQLTTEISDIQSLPHGPWDIILVHNTLVFLTKRERIETLRKMSRLLSSDGVILCGMRYNSITQAFDAEDERRECNSAFEIISNTFSQYSNVIELLRPMIQPYVKTQLKSLSHRADRSTFYSELNEAGFVVVDSYPDQKVLPSVASELDLTLNIEAELMLLKVGRHSSMVKEIYVP